MRRFYRFIAVLIIAGALFSAAGLLLGAKTMISIDSGGVHAGPTAADHETHVSEDNIAAFTGIDVRMLAAQVNCVAADQYGFTIDSTSSDITWGVQNGKLTISETGPWWRSFAIGIPALSRATNAITIYVQKDAALNSVYIQNTSGDVSLSDMRCDTLELRQTSGDLSIQRLSAQTTVISSVSGGLSVADSDIGIGEIGLTSGDVRMSGIHSSALTISTVSGGIDARGAMLGATSVHTTSGDIMLWFDDKTDAYRGDLSTLSGNILLNGQRQGGTASVGGADAPNSIHAQSTSGNIRVDFDMKGVPSR